jgi:hypothetical protein
MLHCSMTCMIVYYNNIMSGSTLPESQLSKENIILYSFFCGSM